MSGSNSGLFGMDPETARNLLMFGASTMAAANARTPQGFLAYGSGALGPIGAGLMGMNDQAMQQAKLRSELGYQGAQTQNLQEQASLADINRQLMQQKLQFMPQMLNTLGVGGNSAPPMMTAAPDVTGSALPMIQRDKSQTAGMQANNSSNLMYAGQPDATGVIPLPDGQKLAQFPDMPTGIAASARQLMTNADQHGVQTVTQMVQRWVNGDKAPPPNQDLSSYIADTSKALGVGPNVPVNWHDPNAQSAFLMAQYPHESAGGSTSLKAADVLAGVRRANGMQPFQVAQAGNGPIPMPGQTSTSNSQGAAPTAGGMTAEQAEAQAQAYQRQAMAAQYVGMDATPWTQRAQQLQAYANQLRLQQSQTAATEEINRTKPLAGRNWFAPQGANGPIVKIPEVHTIVNPDNSEGYVSIAPGIGNSPQQVETINGPDNKPLVAKLSPQQHEFGEERGKGLGEQFNSIDTQAAAAVQNNYLFDNMRADSQTWDMNKFADWEGDARAYMKAIANNLGIKTPQMDQKIADFTSFSKSSGMLLREAVHETSSRAAVQEYKLIGESLPTPTTTKESFEQIAAQWQGLNDYRIAKQKFAQGYQDDPKNFNVAFNSSMSPTSFMLNRMSQTPEGQQMMQAMLSRMQQNPEGRMLAKRMLQQYSYAKANGYFTNLPQD